MIRSSLHRSWLLCKKNITVYIKQGPVLMFGLLFPFFMTLSWIIGRDVSLDVVFIGIVAMTSFFTATAISPVILPIETREKSLERILVSPISLKENLFGIILASTLYSLIITTIITITLILLFSIMFNSVFLVFLLFVGIGLMAILGSLLGLLVAGYHTDNFANIMILVNLVKFPLLFMSGIFIPFNELPSQMVYLSFISPLTFLTDLLRYSVDGSNYFTWEFDMYMLIIWLVLLLIVGYLIHKKTMPKRFLASRKSKKK